MLSHLLNLTTAVLTHSCPEISVRQGSMTLTSQQTRVLGKHITDPIHHRSYLNALTKYGLSLYMPVIWCVIFYLLKCKDNINMYHIFICSKMAMPSQMAMPRMEMIAELSPLKKGARRKRKLRV